MKLIKDRKLFGVLNIVDIIVIVLIIAMVGVSVALERRADIDHPADALLPQPVQQRIPVRVEALVIIMCMCTKNQIYSPLLSVLQGAGDRLRGSEIDGGFPPGGRQLHSAKLSERKRTLSFACPMGKRRRRRGPAHRDHRFAYHTIK